MKKISPWIYAARPKTLTASIVPIVCAISIVPTDIVIKKNILFFTFIAAIIIQVITNYINDLYDFLKGSDKNRLGPDRMLQSGLISIENMKLGISILFVLAVITGLPLVIHGGWPILTIGLSSFLFAYMYTAGPVPLAYNGLGDLFVFLYFGLIAVSGTYYLQTGFFDQNSIWLGCSIGLKNVILLCVNNFRDYEEDKKNNKKTLIVFMGKSFGKIQIIMIMILSYYCLYKLSILLEEKLSFYIFTISMPLAMMIIFDILNKKSSELNETLAKASLLLLTNAILIVIGTQI